MNSGVVGVGANAAGLVGASGNGGFGDNGMTMTDVNEGSNGLVGAKGADNVAGVQGNPAVAGAPKEMPGEPVANPFSMTLPPPPAPTVGPDMMPPAMPMK